jgi:hypothetical protein
MQQEPRGGYAPVEISPVSMKSARNAAPWSRWMRRNEERSALQRQVAGLVSN